MKRSAGPSDVDEAAVAKQPRQSRRLTRLTQRQTDLELAQVQEEVKLEKERLEKAEALMATPFLQALPLVVGSGLLYKRECRSVALASKSCLAIVAEKIHELPRVSQVEVEVSFSTRDNGQWPTWVRQRGLQHDIPTQEFARAIFDKLCDLKVSSETSERKKKKVRDSLPIWSVDVLIVELFVWGSSTRNNGGIHFTFVTDRNWVVRLDNNLILWTWNHFHKWRKIYNYQPLWHWEGDMEFAIWEDSEEEDDEGSVALWL